MKKFFSIVLIALMGLMANGASAAEASQSNNEIILHAWSWSFNTIREHLPEIKDAGYTIVQTSPINECVVGEGGGRQLFGHGKWYYHYQPTDWTIGNYQLGTRDEFKAMCAEAKRLGLRVIVDVLPNHTVIDRSQINARLDSAVHGRENLFHANGLWPIKDYSDRYQCTTGEMGTLPDVNTENPDFQYYYMQYVNDVLACGASGFRYDTAKHIGLPGEMRDPKSPENDFWDVAMGRKAVKGLRLAVPREQLFIYGEVLQDRNVPEQGYAEYMDLTASNYGWVLRNVLNPPRYLGGVARHLLQRTRLGRHERRAHPPGMGLPDRTPVWHASVLQPSSRQHPRELLGRQRDRQGGQRRVQAPRGEGRERVPPPHGQPAREYRL